MAKAGDRVLALSHEEDGVVYVFGYGTYEDWRRPSEVPEEHRPGGWMGEAMIEIDAPGPCILLDNGERVWGCECWWGLAEAAEKRIKGKPTRAASIGDARRKAKEASGT